MSEENEDWVLQEGSIAVQQKALHGIQCMDPRTLLIYALWVCDYGMRNAGDLLPALDIFPDVLKAGKRSADTLEIVVARKLFGLDKDQFENMYFEKFDSVCDEIRSL